MNSAHQEATRLPTARILSTQEIRNIIDAAHDSHMASLPPVERPTAADMLEGNRIFAPWTS